jgi:hypothetical protein
MIHPRDDSIYLSAVTFSELNVFSQNYLPHWPNNPFDDADFLRILIVIVPVVVIVRAVVIVIDSGNSNRVNLIHQPTT